MIGIQNRCSILLLLAALLMAHHNKPVMGFSVKSPSSARAVSLTRNGKSTRNTRGTVVVLREGEQDSPSPSPTTTTTEATKLSLEEKMKNWEASDEEIKAATLGGVVPERADGFDVGLYIAFPFMVIGCLLFLAFPLLAGNIDVSSVGPPPTS